MRNYAALSRLTYRGLVLRRYSFACRPGWIVLHVLTIALVVTMVLLGRWQLIVSNEKHFNLRNFGYALQWWAFTAFALLMWVRILRDQAHHVHDPQAPEITSAVSDDEPVAYRRYVPPTTTEVGDDMHASYNDYLAGLHAKRRGPTERRP